MKSVSVTLLLICTVLALSAVGQGQKLSEIKKKALVLVREDLHSKNTTKHAYRLIAVLKATEEHIYIDTFVKIEAKLQQTTCKKEFHEKKKCRTLPRGSIEHCTGCFVFEKNSHVVLSQYIDCCPETSLTMDQENVRIVSCENMVKKYLPGSMTFLLASNPYHAVTRIMEEALPATAPPPPPQLYIGHLETLNKIETYH
ncbi:retinoic acid receptor responder protein 2-like [Bombina bombina]|uniref:retinoic acid receptor responder protein 2-like n=1 Tax=Bombina bombina TaxID=8345 RepID=UPI00235A5694|nr:retinoic acid receptor responder protein 2-like [Bombina bombina]